MAQHTIALIPGDGIGREVVPAAVAVLDHLGHAEAARAVDRAIETVLSDPRLRTRELGGKASTRELTDAVVQAVG
jgi:tartrate dehydrogenase/decarboxylase / D-malate dehydrogenase